jgi:hypothetical protein
MNRFIATCFAAAALCTSACSDSSGSSGNNATSAVAISYTVVSSGVQIGIQNQQLQIITDAGQFASLMSTLTLSGNIPSVDFSANELIGIFLGASVGPCGNDQLSISSVQESDSTVTVNASRQVTVPPPGFGACVRPPPGLSYDLVTIPITTKPISLIFN